MSKNYSTQNRNPTDTDLFCTSLPLNSSINSNDHPATIRSIASEPGLDAELHPIHNGFMYNDGGLAPYYMDAPDTAIPTDAQLTPIGKFLKVSGTTATVYDPDGKIAGTIENTSDIRVSEKNVAEDYDDVIPFTDGSGNLAGVKLINKLSHDTGDIALDILDADGRLIQPRIRPIPNPVPLRTILAVNFIRLCRVNTANTGIVALAQYNDSIRGKLIQLIIFRLVGESLVEDNVWEIFDYDMSNHIGTGVYLPERNFVASSYSQNADQSDGRNYVFFINCVKNSSTATDDEKKHGQHRIFTCPSNLYNPTVLEPYMSFADGTSDKPVCIAMQKGGIVGHLIVNSSGIAGTYIDYTVMTNNLIFPCWRVSFNGQAMVATPIRPTSKSPTSTLNIINAAYFTKAVVMPDGHVVGKFKYFYTSIWFDAIKTPIMYGYKSGTSLNIYSEESYTNEVNAWVGDYRAPLGIGYAAINTTTPGNARSYVDYRTIHNGFMDNWSMQGIYLNFNTTQDLSNDGVIHTNPIGLSGQSACGSMVVSAASNEIDGDLFVNYLFKENIQSTGNTYNINIPTNTIDPSAIFLGADFWGEPDSFVLCLHRKQGGWKFIKARQSGDILLNEISTGVYRTNLAQTGEKGASNTIFDLNLIRGYPDYSGIGLLGCVIPEETTPPELFTYRIKDKYSYGHDLINIPNDFKKNADYSVLLLPPKLPFAQFDSKGNYVASYNPVSGSWQWNEDDNYNITADSNPYLPIPIQAPLNNGVWQLGDEYLAGSSGNVGFIGDVTVGINYLDIKPQAVWRLYGILYLYDGTNIYRVQQGNQSVGTIGLPTVQAFAPGLKFLCASDKLGYFVSPYDNTLYTYDGGQQLNKYLGCSNLDWFTKGQFNMATNTVYLNDKYLLREGILSDWCAGHSADSKILLSVDGPWIPPIATNNSQWRRLSFRPKNPRLGPNSIAAFSPSYQSAWFGLGNNEMIHIDRISVYIIFKFSINDIPQPPIDHEVDFTYSYQEHGSVGNNFNAGQSAHLSEQTKRIFISDVKLERLTDGSCGCRLEFVPKQQDVIGGSFQLDFLLDGHNAYVVQDLSVWWKHSHRLVVNKDNRR